MRMTALPNVTAATLADLDTRIKLFSLIWSVVDLAVATPSPSSHGDFSYYDYCEELEPENETLSHMVLRTILNDSYNKNILPSKQGVNVVLEFVIQTIAEISEITGSFTSDVLFRYMIVHNVHRQMAAGEHRYFGYVRI